MSCTPINVSHVFDLIKGGFKSYILIDCIPECLNLKKMLWEDSFIVLNSSGFLGEIKFYDRNSISSDSSSENVICWHFYKSKTSKWNKYFFKQLKTCKGCAYVASHLSLNNKFFKLLYFFFYSFNIICLMKLLKLTQHPITEKRKDKLKILQGKN